MQAPSLPELVPQTGTDLATSSEAYIYFTASVKPVRP